MVLPVDGIPTITIHFNFVLKYLEEVIEIYLS